MKPSPLHQYLEYLRLGHMAEHYEALAREAAEKGWSLVDYLQRLLEGEYLARHKSRKGADSRSDWLVALSAHCVIHAGGVWLVSGSLTLAAVELTLHGLTDLGKGEEKYGLVPDQLLHLACKLGYVLVLTYGWSSPS